MLCNRLLSTGLLNRAMLSLFKHVLDIGSIQCFEFALSFHRPMLRSITVRFTHTLRTVISNAKAVPVLHRSV
jgi:hypothetical protein